MKPINKKIYLFLITTLLIPVTSFAFVIIKNIEAPITNNFSLTPSNIEFELIDKNTDTKELKVSNSTGETSEFTVEFESSDLENKQTISTIPIQQYLSVDKNKFILEHGEDAILKITAKVPNANNSKFINGTVLATRRSIEDGGAGSQVLTRLGALVFVDIGKTAIRSGYLSGFSGWGGQYFVTFRNAGEAKLNPYGFVEVRGLTGGFIEKINIDPFFVLPDSEKQILVKSTNKFSFSPFYIARLVLYPGYGDGKNTETELINIYNYYAIGSYLLFILFLIAIFIFFKKYAKK